MSVRTALVWILAAVLMGAAAACAVAPSGAPAASACDGIAFEVGGCEDGLPVFIGADCQSIGREFGTHLNVQTVGVIIGPADVGGEAKSVRIKQAMVLLVDLANRRLRETGLHGSCDGPEFLAAARTQFSAQLQAGVGLALYDGNPVASYQEWLDELGRTVSVIDTEE